MTKPKLTDAVKQPSEKLPETAQAPAAAADSGTGGAAGLPPAAGKDKGSDDSGDDDEPEASAGAAGKPNDPPAPAKAAAASQEAPAASGANKTLAEYKAAFGDVQGCVYFAEGVEFSAACAKHIEAQGKQIADLKAANETLTTQTASLAKEVLGTAEPLKTGSENAKTGGKSQIDEYASLLESKLEKLK
jgi:hypothetical protein